MTTAPITDPIERLHAAAQALGGAIHSGPRRTALLARYYRVVAPLLEERDELRRKVEHGYERITEERARIGVAWNSDTPEPADARFQKGVDRWLGWTARLTEIEDALAASAKRAGVRV